MMYEYANRLAELGYSVHVSYSLKTKFIKYRWSYPIRFLLSRIEGFSTNEWFAFHKSITREYVNEVSERYVKDADVVIATWWSTAMDMGQLSSKKGKKINLIQGYEDWEGHVDLLHASYNMDDVTNVVVSSYLEKKISNYTQKKPVLIFNAIDNNKFYLAKSIEKRNPETICMLYSIQEIKGTEYGLEALKIVKEYYPSLKVELFGICPEPEGLPEWMKFYRNPEDLSDLYNRNAIFISNSLTEGMALTPMEAMACGCASILTDIDGHADYGKNGETALMYEAKNTDQLVNRLLEFIKDNQKRITIARNGNSFVQQFSWDNAIHKMDHLIKTLLDK